MRHLVLLFAVAAFSSLTWAENNNFGGTPPQTECQTERNDIQTKIGAGQAACNKVGKMTGNDDLTGPTPDLNVCLQDVTCNTQNTLTKVQTKSDSTSTGSDSDDSESGNTDPNKTFCGQVDSQTLVDSLSKNLTKEKSAMDDDADAVNKAQNDSMSKAQQETTNEQNAQDQITKETQILQQGVVNAQSKIQQTNLKAKETLIKMDNDLRKIKSDAMDILTTKRDEAMNEFTQGCNAALMKCEATVASVTGGDIFNPNSPNTQVQNVNRYQTSSLSSDLSSRGQYGACSTYSTSPGRTYLDACQSLRQDMLAKLDALTTEYKQKQADAQAQAKDMANTQAQALQQENDISTQTKLMVQQTTVQVQNLQNKVRQSQAQFKQQQQADQVRLTQLQQEAQQSSTQYNSDYKIYQTLQNQGYVPNAGDTQASQISTIQQQVSDAVTALARQAALTSATCSGSDQAADTGAGAQSDSGNSTTPAPAQQQRARQPASTGRSGRAN